VWIGFDSFILRWESGAARAVDIEKFSRKSTTPNPYLE